MKVIKFRRYKHIGIVEGAYNNRPILLEKGLEPIFVAKHKDENELVDKFGLNYEQIGECRFYVGVTERR
ncbi:hypothetical protein BKP35_09000 [Anaerobacillus arseniciselenatis]|uniref:Uncharacterized protein n=1 Tax=Anaerobacillus arseniciselenatis TaxID=85682 RepID=A0A1S2LLI4_9BACI|nr:hypothetical protein [Anaerobacillus arseniciselenatis]OIJ13362.1 hypothetical protein BKP35_09000 [Anaerobacillus arseniciselenatis]